jgi:hypothetical protein
MHADIEKMAAGEAGVRPQQAADFRLRDDGLFGSHVFRPGIAP